MLGQGRSGDCELTLNEDDEITCVDEGIAIRFLYFSFAHSNVKICFPEMFLEPSVTSAAGAKYGAGEKMSNTGGFI